MLVILNSSVILTMQIILVYSLMEKRFSKKKTFTILIPSLTVIFTITAILYLTNGYAFAAKLYLLTIGLPIYLVLFYLSKHRGFCMLFNVLTSGFLITVISMPGYFFTKNFDTYIMASLIGRLVLFPFILILVIKVFRPLYMQMIEKLKNIWTLLCLIPLLSYVITTHMLVYPISVFERPENAITLAICITIIIITYAVISIFFYYMSKQFTIQNEQQLLKLQIGALKNQLVTIKEVEEKSNIMKHDMRHYVQSILALLQSGKSEETERFVSKIEDTLKQTDKIKYCENQVLNAILTYYIERATKEGIEVTTRLDIPEKIPVDEIELSTVFANAIENACNACRKLPGDTARTMELVCVSKQHFVLEIANTYLGKVDLGRNGLPISKQKGHGIGTQSIVAFVKKHNAIIDYQTDNNMFKLRIML